MVRRISYLYILHMFNMLCFALAEVLVVLCSALRFGPNAHFEAGPRVHGSSTSLFTRVTSVENHPF